jgi:GT2 family glycosyltransferase
LKNCLDSLQRVFNEKLEIIVVDNAASSSTSSLVSCYSSVKYISSPGNPGFAGGNNIGLKETTREYILLLNNDTIVYENSFTSLAQFLKNHKRERFKKAAFGAVLIRKCAN